MGVYFLRVMSEEDEDLNAFGLWDSVGASVMLGVVPAALCYIFNKHDVASTVMLLGVALLAGGVVYLLGLVMPGRVLGRIVNLLGLVLTIIYIVAAYWMWSDAVQRDFPSLQGQEVKEK